MSTQTDAQAEQPDRQALQAAGTHPAPCARHCEAQAFEIAARGMRRQIAELQAALAEQPAQQEPYGWHTEDHLTDRSATTYSKDVADRWQSKGWPVTPFYTAHGITKENT